MKHLLFGAFGAALVLGCAASAIAAEEAGDPQAGFEYAHTYCANCHGISEEKSPLREATRFRIVADRPGMTATALQVWMQTSHPTMPNIIVVPKDMLNVIAYIVSLKGREGSKP
jgi:mono/diheme cytochrome c family protein